MSTETLAMWRLVYFQGLDSSLIGSMKNQLGSKIKGFNIDYEEKFDVAESEEATFAANHIGLDLSKTK